MAIYRLSSSSISRGKGQSAVACASYRSGEKLKDEGLKKEFDYSRKQNIDDKLILLPKNANQNYSNREKLWNAVEKSEKRINSELAKEYTLALPTELSKDQQKALVDDFCKSQFVEKGLAIDIAFHNLNLENPHCHIMTTTRSFNEEGELGQKERFFKPKNYLIELRKDWELSINKEFERLGIDERVTADSYLKQGLDIDSTHTAFNRQEAKLEKMKTNGEKLLENVSQIATSLTHNKATFSDREFAKFISRNSIEEQQSKIIELIQEDQNFVCLDSEKGIWTSTEYLAKEAKMFENIEQMHKPDLKKEVKFESIENTTQNMGLSYEQSGALLYATNNDSNVKNIQGFAGTGKSYVIRAINKVYEQQGFNVRGLALSGIVADNLAKDSKIEHSSTIASFLNQYEKGRETIDSKTVFVIDEASLLSTDEYKQITDIASDKGAKLISVGDNQQLQAIRAGGAYRGICEATNNYTLENIRRQHSFGDKQATLDLSNGEIELGLGNYQQKKAINYHENRKSLTNTILSSYLDDIENGRESIILAHKKAVVDEINASVSAKLHKQGELSKKWLRVNGVTYRENERFVFLQNDYSLNVRNGTTGTIQKIEGKELQIKTDDDRTINFNTTEYDSFVKAYAMTIHKAQGVTVDSTHLYLDRNTTSNLALVGCSRHKEDLKIYTLKEQIPDFESLVKCAEHSDVKELVNDRYELSIEAIGQSRQLTEDRSLTQLETSIERSKAYLEYENAKDNLYQHKYGNAIHLANEMNEGLKEANYLYKQKKEGKAINNYEIKSEYREIERTYLKADDYDKEKIKELTSSLREFSKLDNHIQKIETQQQEKQIEISKSKSYDRENGLSL